MKSLFQSVASGLGSGAELILDVVMEEQARELDESARAALDRGDEAEARELWRKAHRLDPANPGTAAGLASIERRQTPRAEAPIQLDGREQALMLVKHAREAHEEGDDLLAIEILRQAQRLAVSDRELMEGVAGTLALLEARVRAASSTEKPRRPPVRDAGSARRVFISYPRRDRDWVDRIRAHLKAATSTFGDVVWDDSRLKPGDMWETEIEQALSQAEVAILFLSADYFASDFVRLKELPALEHRLRQGEVKIVPIFLRDAPMRADHFLLSIQGANTPARPLTVFSEPEVDHLFAELARGVAMLLETSAK